MIKTIKHSIADFICSIAFFYDENFLTDLPENEDNWTKWQWFKWRIMSKIYMFGVRLYS